MPLARLHKAYAEVTQYTEPEVLVSDPGWLFAQKCEARWLLDGAYTDPVTLLLVYRSVMVRDSSRMYAPVADHILKARRVEVFSRGFLEDLGMMRGRGEYFVARMTDQPEFPKARISTESEWEEVASAVGAAVCSVFKSGAKV